ncbi:MAG: vitamin B12 dependent methionine synthase [Anaerolineae bacterium]|nr:vitamin B12 dependent methionine synthase [Anaerolineae bacterium]
MRPVTLATIPFAVDLQSLAVRVHLRPEKVQSGDFEKMLLEAQSVARPKACYRIAYIEHKDSDTVILDKIPFTSRVLRVNLKNAQRVFVFAATCGTELEEWSHTYRELLQQYWADAIKEAALDCAYQFLLDHLEKEHRPGNLSEISPGSIEDFPISQQTALFRLLGDTQRNIGVTLTESLLMLPIKSISGILFPTEERFESCQLCPRPVCPGRRAPFDPTLYKRKYQVTTS